MPYSCLNLFLSDKLSLLELNLGEEGQLYAIYLYDVFAVYENFRLIQFLSCSIRISRNIQTGGQDTCILS